MESIRISIIQTDIVWENKQENLRLLHEKLQSLRGITEIVVLPEMFSTGFSMQSKMLAEPNSGATITILKQWAAQFQLAICGSYIATENDQFYNRKEKNSIMTNVTCFVWEGKPNIFRSVTNDLSSPIVDGISACWFAMISVFLYGAGT